MESPSLDVQTLLTQAGRLQTAGRHADALLVLRQAAAQAPDQPHPRFMLANSLMALGHAEEAEALYRGVVEAHPRRGMVLNNLAMALVAQRRLKEAEELVQRALAFNPKLAEAYGTLSEVCAGFGDPVGAEDAARRGAALRPDIIGFPLTIGNALLQQHRLPEALAHYRRSMAQHPESPEIHSNLLWMLNDTEGVTPDQVFEAHAAWGRKYGGAIPPIRGHANTPDPERPLRVGLLTNHLRDNHPATIFITSLFQYHDPKALSLSVYWTGSESDDVTAQFRDWTDHWVDVSGLNEREIAARIQTDGVDILLERGGHGGSYCRLLVFASKPAPIQVAWMGYQNTRGLETIDYYLGDTLCNPPETQRWMVERVFAIEGPLVTYLPVPANPPAPPAPLPALANSAITFGVFGRSVKYQPRMIHLWCELLRRLPTARLVLKGHFYGVPVTRQNVLAPFLAEGIDPARIQFLSGTNRVKYLADLEKVDVLLDTFPNTGVTVTLDALWMGVPVVSLRGATGLSRMGLSMLTHAGHPEWVAEDDEGYLAAALRLAADVPALARLRAGLRAELMASPICDGPTHARRLEEAFRQMWRTWCATQGGKG